MTPARSATSRVVVPRLPKAGFHYTEGELLSLLSLPALVGAVMRFPYTFAVPKFGGRNWTVVSALLLLIPFGGPKEPRRRFEPVQALRRYRRILGMPVARLGEMVSRFVDRPVVDKTGLTGKYDVAIDLSMEDIMKVARSAGMAVPSGGGANRCGISTTVVCGA